MDIHINDKSFDFSLFSIFDPLHGEQISFIFANVFRVIFFPISLASNANISSQLADGFSRYVSTVLDHVSQLVCNELISCFFF